MALPAFLAGAAAILVSAQTVHRFVTSPEGADSRKAYLDFAKKTLTARSTEQLSTDEVSEAAQINADLKRLTRNAKGGWTSDADKDSLGRVFRYVPTAHAKIILSKGVDAVDSGIKTAIDALESIRPARKK